MNSFYNTIQLFISRAQKKLSNDVVFASSTEVDDGKFVQHDENDVLLAKLAPSCTKKRNRIPHKFERYNKRQKNGNDRDHVPFVKKGKKCTFCDTTGHQYQNCMVLRNLGITLIGRDKKKKKF